jgi:5-methylcytosine-specific restriction endonuclease McrA
MRRDHVRRARPLFQTVDYSLDELIAFVKAHSTCAYCGCVLTAGTFSLDHASPISRKADFRLSNHRTACVICQERKADLTEDEYRQILNLISGWPPAAGTSVLRRSRAGGAQLAYKRRLRSKLDFGPSVPE